MHTMLRSKLVQSVEADSPQASFGLWIHDYTDFLPRALSIRRVPGLWMQKSTVASRAGNAIETVPHAPGMNLAAITERTVLALPATVGVPSIWMQIAAVELEAVDAMRTRLHAGSWRRRHRSK